MTMVAIVERPWSRDVPPPAKSSAAIEDPMAKEPVTYDDPAALTRGILVGLGASVPLWLGVAWLVIRLVELLLVR
jgi:hypothetical protein